MIGVLGETYTGAIKYGMTDAEIFRYFCNRLIIVAPHNEGEKEDIGNLEEELKEELAGVLN